MSFGVDLSMESARRFNACGGDPAGALIASMPPNIVHRLIINLVIDTKKVGLSPWCVAHRSPSLLASRMFPFSQLKAKDHVHRAAVQKLQSALDTAQRECEQLAAARRAEALARSRLGVSEQAAEEMRRERDIAAKERVAVEARNRDLAAQLDGLQRQQIRLEAKVRGCVFTSGWRV